MLTPSISADNTASADASPAERIALILRGLLPAGAELAVCWRDWALGNGNGATPGASAALKRRAEHALVDATGDGDDADLRVHAWDNADGNARVALAFSLPQPLAAADEASWVLLARTLLVTSLDALRAQARVVSLEKSKRLQQALYEIADLAGADLEMPEMLRRIHAVVNSLMYAENCYIVLYDDQRRTVRFLYFADQRDPYIAEPEREFGEEEMANSMTFAMLRHGQPLRGPSAVIRQKLGVVRDPSHGPDSLDWLGVPMRRDDRVCGAIVVQSYDTPASYADEDRALLGYVAQHILTALDRKHAHVELEHRVAVRTHELQRANRELQAEIMERKRAEKLQRALFRITELAITSESLERFYADVHVVVDELIDARNFYIALVSDDGGQLNFPYSIDERDPMRKARRMTNGLTEYVIATGRPLLADREVIGELANAGKLQQHGPPAYSWLGVPLFRGEDVVGTVVVQELLPGSQVHVPRPEPVDVRGAPYRQRTRSPAHAGAVAQRACRARAPRRRAYPRTQRSQPPVACADRRAPPHRAAADPPGHARRADRPAQPTAVAGPARRCHRASPPWRRAGVRGALP